MELTFAYNATIMAITEDLIRIIIQTSASTDVHLTRAFIVPKQILPNIIQSIAILGESVGVCLSLIVIKLVISGPSFARFVIEPKPLPNPLFFI